MDYDDEETDSDEDIRETYGYDVKVCDESFSFSDEVKPLTRSVRVQCVLQT